MDRNQPDSLEKHLRNIAQSGFDRIIVVAGDGTLNRAIQFLHQQNQLGQFTFGLIPLGTCNDFAKILGFRKRRLHRRNVELAMEAAAGNSVREISVAKVNDRCFVNNAGFGRRNPSQKKRGAISAIRGMKPVATHVVYDGQTHSGHFYMMIAANAPYFSNGLHFSKESDPADNQIEFFFVKAISKFRLLAKLFLGVRGIPLMRHRRPDPTVWKTKAESLTVKTESPVWIQVDGEVAPSLSEIREAKFEMAGKCKFLVPK